MDREESPELALGTSMLQLSTSKQGTASICLERALPGDTSCTGSPPGSVPPPAFLLYAAADQSLSGLYYNWKLNDPKLASIIQYVSIKKLQNKHLTLDPDSHHILWGDASRTLSKGTAFCKQTLECLIKVSDSR